MVPAEPLWDIFTPAVIGKLQAVRSPSEYLQCRLAILGAGAVNPSPLNYELRAFKSAWETYLTAAYAIGLFDGVHGTDLRARLTDVDDNNHLAAVSECFAAWYLAGRRRLPLQPRPAGDQRSCLEFLIEHRDGNINVEVKAPHRQITNEFFGVMTAISLKQHFNRPTSNSQKVNAICWSSIRVCDRRSFQSCNARRSSEPLSAKRPSAFQST